MIQRIQSVLLALAGILNLTTLFLPLWETQNAAQTNTALLSGLKITTTGDAAAQVQAETISLTGDVLLLIHFVLIVAVSLSFFGLIMLYKDRIKQMLFVRLSTALTGIQIVVGVMLCRKLGTFVGAEGAEGVVQFGFFFPAAAMIAAWFASKRIKHDEDLVKSADRFR